MDSPKLIYLLRWLVRDTFCQALASRIFWIMLGVTAFATLFCLGIRVEGGDGLRIPDDLFLGHPQSGQPLTGPTNDLGSLEMLFGVMKISLPRDRASGVELLYVALGSWVAGALGVLLTLVWAAGIIPDFLQPAHAALLLAKPIPRWLLLLGKYLGVVLFVAVQAGLFFTSTWFALGLRTGIWELGYLAGAPLMTLHFAALYSFALLLGVATRSTVAGVLGSLLFWVICTSVNLARHTATMLPDLTQQTQTLSPFTRFLAELGYWILPKPIDYLITLEHALNANKHMMTLSASPELSHVLNSRSFDAPAIVLSSLLFCVLMLFISNRQLAQTDY